jgi:hypothetical protein
MILVKKHRSSKSVWNEWQSNVYTMFQKFWQSILIERITPETIDVTNTVQTESCQCHHVDEIEIPLLLP